MNISIAAILHLYKIFSFGQDIKISIMLTLIACISFSSIVLCHCSDVQILFQNKTFIVYNVWIFVTTFREEIKETLKTCQPPCYKIE